MEGGAARRLGASAAGLGLLGAALALPWADALVTPAPIPPYRETGPAPAVYSGFATLVDWWPATLWIGLGLLALTGGAVLVWMVRPAWDWSWPPALDVTLALAAAALGVAWGHVLVAARLGTLLLGVFETHQYTALRPTFWLVPGAILLAGAVRAVGGGRRP